MAVRMLLPHGEYNIKVQQDCGACNSFGSCLLPDRTVMVTDWNNERLKRLDASYSITDHCDMPGQPWGVTCINPYVVAITLTFKKKVEFVSVRDSMYVIRSMSFFTSVNCRGIVYSKKELFVSCGGYSGEGPGHIAVYSVNGAPRRSLHGEHTLNGEQLISDAIGITASPDCARIYVADYDRGVLSSDRRGNRVRFFTNPSLKGALCVCILAYGHVLVCGFNSNNVVMFDGAGRCRGELLSCADDILEPTSLSYDSSRARLIVTMYRNDKIKVFDLV